MLKSAAWRRFKRSCGDTALPNGDRQGTWAVKVSGNWRVTFVFHGKDAESVDYEDYH